MFTSSSLVNRFQLTRPIYYFQKIFGLQFIEHIHLELYGYLYLGWDRFSYTVIHLPVLNLPKKVRQIGYLDNAVSEQLFHQQRNAKSLFAVNVLLSESSQTWRGREISCQAAFFPYLSLYLFPSLSLSLSLSLSIYLSISLSLPLSS